VRYVQDPNAALSRVLEEHDEKGRIIARYIYGMGLIGREEMRGHNKFSGYGKLSIYHFDSRGNTIALTDEHGHITDRYAYDPYGRLLGHHDGDRDHYHAYHHGRHYDHHETNPFTFCGQFGVMDDGNGLYFMRTRYYAPALMRFVQRDVLYRGSVYSTQSANRYGYVEGNPVLRSDPNGDFFFAAIAVGITIALATQAVNCAINQDWGDWYDWVGAAAGGAIGGAIGGGTVGLVAKWGISSTITLALAGGISGALGGMATSAIQQGFGAIGGESWDWASFGISATVGGVLGAFGGTGLKAMADDLMNSGNFWAIRGFFQNTTRMLKDTLAEETIAGVLEVGAFAGYTFYDVLYGAKASDSLPPETPSNPNTPLIQNLSGGLKNDTN
jgi:RHS repeat-associated protein